MSNTNPEEFAADLETDLGNEDDSNVDQAVGDLRGVLQSDQEDPLSGSVGTNETSGRSSGDDFGQSAGPRQHAGSALESNMDLILDIPIEAQVVLGTSQMAVATLMELDEGEMIALNKKIGDPVDVIVNGRLIGRGEITVLESDSTRFGVRMIEIIGAKKSK